MASENQIRVGAAALIYHHASGKLLMGKRKGAHGAGTWSVPGGHVEFGEEPAEALRREIFEETGLKVGRIAPSRKVPWVSSKFPGKQYITLYFVVEHLGDDPQAMEPDKCDEWAWFDTASLPTPLFEPDAHRILCESEGIEAWVLTMTEVP